MGEESKTLEIRQATRNELEAAYGVAEEYFETMGVVAREGPEEFRREYFGEGRGLWLARYGHDIAGCIALRVLDAVDNHIEVAPTTAVRGASAEIKRMYVRQEWRGRGIAQKLLDAAEEFARKSGYEWIYLDTTDEMRAAARLYERNGYERCERYNENPQATIFMRKRLRPA